VSFSDFLWAPSGRALYFEGVSRGVRNLWKVEVEPHSLRWVAGPDRLTTGAGLDTDMVLSPMAGDWPLPRELSELASGLSHSTRPQHRVKEKDSRLPLLESSLDSRSVA